MSAFEYDVEKSRANFEKHGIDFHMAQVLWDDPSGLEIRTKHQAELRFIYIGRIGNKHWSAVFTYRGENIRLISVRRSREKEVKLYES